MKQKKPLSSYVEMLRTMIAILISLIIVFAIILLISSQPLSALGDFIFGPLTSVRRFGNFYFPQYLIFRSEHSYP